MRKKLEADSGEIPLAYVRLLAEIGLQEYAKRIRKEFSEMLPAIYERMNRMDPASYETNGQSHARGDQLLIDIFNLIKPSQESNSGYN